MVSIRRSCPNGHVEYEYSGSHELRDDEEYVREMAIPDGGSKCAVCGDELDETVEEGGRDA